MNLDNDVHEKKYLFNTNGCISINIIVIIIVILKLVNYVLFDIISESCIDP